MNSHRVERVLIAMAWTVVTVAASVCLAAVTPIHDRDANWIAPPAAGARVNPLGTPPLAAGNSFSSVARRVTVTAAAARRKRPT
jgi:hypothetical protein